MNAFTKLAEMKEFAKYLASAGYDVQVMQDGTLDVQDPVRVNGKIEYYDTHRLHTARQARKFINDRS